MLIFLFIELKKKNYQCLKLFKLKQKINKWDKVTTHNRNYYYFLNAVENSNLMRFIHSKSYARYISQTFKLSTMKMRQSIEFIRGFVCVLPSFIYIPFSIHILVCDIILKVIIYERLLQNTRKHELQSKWVLAWKQWKMKRNFMSNPKCYSISEKGMNNICIEIISFFCSLQIYWFISNEIHIFAELIFLINKMRF